MFQKYSILLFLFLSSLAAVSQVESNKADAKNTLQDQFEDVIDKANNYQDYKVIKKTKLNSLRKNVLDSIEKLEATIESANVNILQKKNRIDSLTSDLNNTSLNLSNSKQKENEMRFFGIPITKSTYNSLMYTLIGLLIFGLLLFVYKFRKSNAITNEARIKLDETETEFDLHRQKTLEEQQQLRRKLQDEINKNRNV